jgi:hypothetical protein
MVLELLRETIGQAGYYLMSDSRIWLMTLYNKGEMSDLNPAEKRALKSALDAELARRSWRRAPRRT